MTQEKKYEIGKVDAETVIQIGFDVLDILAGRFRQEMGRQFERVWAEGLSQLTGATRILFEDIHVEKENLSLNITIMRARYGDMEAEGDHLVILRAFMEVMGIVLKGVRKYLGEGLVKEALREAVRILRLVERHQKDMGVAEIFIRRIQEGL